MCHVCQVVSLSVETNERSAACLRCFHCLENYLPFPPSESLVPYNFHEKHLVCVRLRPVTPVRALIAEAKSQPVREKPVITGSEYDSGMYDWLINCLADSMACSMLK